MYQDQRRSVTTSAFPARSCLLLPKNSRRRIFARSLHYNGIYFTSVNLAYFTSALRAVWGTSSTDSWAVGNLGSALHRSGSRWLGVAAADSLAADLNAVTGRSTNDVWFGGGSGLVLQWDQASSRNR